VRPDGRSLKKFRPVSVNVGSIKTAEGSAIVKIGNTVVVCGIKAVSGVFILWFSPFHRACCHIHFVKKPTHALASKNTLLHSQ
jgi:ribonuclease PH